ncbi:MAG: hypothetical protein COV91_03625 [Candidatus Taylorbacteria bacterium CG11_big_fil_rev_8_21_14_0_20_46_11]|uniref:Peptidase n=1 Tax=Candidatus Taylorbacteria bacterium CG11_big_fil_rev_8_21_14_0_20_46_11 TaxID=1975025 RepID=A0A2H0KBC9_9BACT|nr:MAG: hypothetical protein COV91_03625 [Candidatus Taylorbacteria bacterium CG11_big_fil_rev_8_21_14_0_20_46_11]
MRKLLLLSSLRNVINGNLPPVLGKPFSEFKAVHVINASKGVSDLKYFERNKAFFRENGWNIEELDLDGKNEDDLRLILKDKDLVYVEGGNTFCLLKSIRESGFDVVIRELLPQGLIYMGASAGSYVACPTIEMATWKQEKNRFGITDVTAMNLVPFLLFAHYTPEYKSMLEGKIPEASYPVRILADGQALFVQDDVVAFIGGPEVTLS